MRAHGKRKITLLVLIGFALLVLGAANVPAMLVEMSADPVEFATSAYTPHAAIHIDGNADFIAQATSESWHGNGTAAAPFLITGYYFYDITHSVEVWNVDLHWAFVYNEVDGPYDGTVWCSIELDNCTNAEVSHNLFHHRFRGIWFVDITNVVIRNNTIVDNLSQGMEIVGSATNVLIEGNYIDNCDGSGIRVQGSTGCQIEDNVIKNVALTGIQLLTSASDTIISNNRLENLGSMGIQSATSSSLSIMHNQITNCSGEAFYLLESSGCEIYNNTATNGSDFGLRLKDFNHGTVQNNSLNSMDDSGIVVESGNASFFKFNRIESCCEYGFDACIETGNLTITQNAFFGNGGISSQINDDGQDNTFIYNYYDEWTSPDTNSDAIVDSPYTIDGTAANDDAFPLADPNAIPPAPESTTSTTDGSSDLPMETLMIAGGGVVVVLVVVFILRRRWS
jgi:parallel beta-helix repeat protein